MVIRRSRLTLIFIYVILFFALCAKPISSHGKEDTPAPTPSKDNDNGEESESESDTPGAAPSSGPSADSPLSVSELFELSMPEIGLQKSSCDQNKDGAKLTITQLEDMKKGIEWWKGWFARRLSCPTVPPKVKKCCEQCQENSGDAIKGIQVSIESINKQDLSKANGDISSISTDVQTCYDCFVEAGAGEDPQINNFNVWVQGVTGECLNNLKKAEIGVQKLSDEQNNDGIKMAITQLEDIKRRIEAFKTFLPAKKNCNKTPPEAKKCCDTCQENLDDAIDGVTVSMESINKQDLPKANVDINSIATDIQTCNDCFANGEDKDVRPFNWWAKGAVEECLNSLKNAEIGVQKLSVNENKDDPKMTIKQLEDLIKGIEWWKGWFARRLSCGRVPPKVKKCCEQCQENSGDAIKDAQLSIESINNQDLSKANGDISGISTDVQTCYDCWVKAGAGEDPQIINFNVWVKGVTGECHNSLKKVESGVQKLSVDQKNDGTKIAITQLEDIKRRIEAFKTFLPAKKNCNKTPPEAKKCCDTCQENLDNAIDGATASIESINKPDLPKANEDISSIATDIQTCNDCFANGEDKDVRPFNWWAKGAVEECLNSLKNAEIGVQKSSVDPNKDGTEITSTQVEVIKERIETFRKYLQAKKSCPGTPPAAKKCCDQCQPNIDAANDAVTKPNGDISGITKEIQTCNDCFVETGTSEDQHLKMYSTSINEAIEECLGKKEEIGVQKSSVDPNKDGTEMTTTQVEVIKERIETFRKYLQAKKSCPGTPPAAKKCCDQCQPNIDAANDAVTKPNGDISGITKEIQTCNDCFVETGTSEDQHLKMYSTSINEAIEECLGKKEEIGVQKSSVDPNKDGTEMTTTQVEVIKERIETFRKYLQAKKSCPGTPPAAKKCCDQCQPNIDAANDAVTKPNGDISGITKEIQTCNDCFVETGTSEDQHLKMYSTSINEAIEECLGKKEEIGVQKSSVDPNKDGTEITTTQVEVIKERIETFRKYLQAKKSCPGTPPAAKKCCDQCQPNIDAANDAVTKANGDISGITKEIQTCNDCFVETGTSEDQHLKMYSTSINEAIEECLNNLKKEETGVKKIGVQKSSVSQNNDDTKMIITQLEDIKQRIEAFKTYLPSKKNCNKTPPEAKKCCDTCQENLDDAIDGVKVSMESINKQDLPKANIDISGIATDIQTCNDCFVETPKGEDKDVNAFHLALKEITEECLQNLKKAETGVQKSSVEQNSDGTKMTTTQLEGLEQRIEAFKTFLTSKKNCGLTPADAKKCCDKCQENLDDAIDGVKVSMESINKQDLPKANVDISGIATDVQTCNDCFAEKGNGEDKDVKPFNLWVQGVTKECLENLKKA